MASYSALLPCARAEVGQECALQRSHGVTRRAKEACCLHKKLGVCHSRRRSGRRRAARAAAELRAVSASERGGETASARPDGDRESHKAAKMSLSLLTWYVRQMSSTHSTWLNPMAALRAFAVSRSVGVRSTDAGKPGRLMRTFRWFTSAACCSFGSGCASNCAIRVVRERRSWSFCKFGSRKNVTTASSTSMRWVVTAIPWALGRPAARRCDEQRGEVLMGGGVRVGGFCVLCFASFRAAAFAFKDACSLIGSSWPA